MKKFLVFTRPFTSKFTEYYSNNYDIDYISDFKFSVNLDVMSFVYKNFKDASEEEIFDELDYREIIMRDRYLRYIELNIAKKLINLVWTYVVDLFSARQYDGYIGIPVDNYIQHLIVKACYKFNVKAISPVHSPLPYKARVTNLGEYIKVRDADMDEVNEIYELLSNNNFRPVWLSKNRTTIKILKMYLKERVKKIMFEFLKLKNSDPYSFHYNCIYPMKGAITVHSLDVLKVKSLYVSNLNKIQEKAKNFKKVAYLVLQFNPEASINYLIPDNRFSQYDLLMDRIMDSTPSDTLIIVKEHPDIYGYRRYDFYKKFLNRKNVMLVDVNIQTSTMFNLADYIFVTGSSSTGIEGVIKDKTIISFGGAFYGHENNCIHQIKDFDEIKNLEKYLVVIKSTKDEKLAFIKTILDNTFNINYEGLVRSIKINHESNVKATQTILEFMDK
jgi:hypothetical protein